MAHSDIKNANSDDKLSKSKEISPLPVGEVDLGLGKATTNNSPQPEPDNDIKGGSGDQAHPTNQASLSDRFKQAFTLPFRGSGRFSPVQLPRMKKPRFKIRHRNKGIRHDQLNEEKSPRAHIGPTTIRRISEEDIQSLDLSSMDVDGIDKTPDSEVDLEDSFKFHEKVNFGARTRRSLSGLGRMVSNPFTSCFGNRRTGMKKRKQLEMSVMNSNYVTNENSYDYNTKPCEQTE